jgi:hypothetical protein
VDRRVNTFDLTRLEGGQKLLARELVKPKQVLGDFAAIVEIKARLQRMKDRQRFGIALVAGLKRLVVSSNILAEIPHAAEQLVEQGCDHRVGVFGLRA